MAVYTEVGPAEADALCQHLGLGALTELRGIHSGIENTNYYVNTVRGQWVLTLFERLRSEQLPYYLRWRQQVREAFPRYFPLTNVAGFRKIEFVGLPPFDSRDPKYLELHSVMQFVVAVVTPTP